MFNWLVAGLILALIAFAVWMNNLGRKVARGKAAEDGLEDAEKAAEIEERNAGLSADERRKRLFDDK